jgi:hypothetical protein
MDSQPAIRQALCPPESHEYAPSGSFRLLRPTDISASITGRQINTTKRA